MRILILANSSSGVYSFRKELIEELLRKNEIFIVTPDSGKCECLRILGCKVINVSMDRRGINPLKDIKLIQQLYLNIQIIQPELIITYTIKPNIYGGIISRILKIPYAVNITGLGTAFQKEGFLKKAIIKMYKISCKKAKVVFFENSANKDIFLENKIILSDQACLLNGAGVNLDKYFLTEYPQGEITKFLFIGRVMAEKGINELLEAMKLLIKDGVKAELHILGAYEEDYRDIMKEYEKKGWLYYHGFQKDIREFIQKAHCFVLPSWHEGMANTNLECAASGRPVITSNIPGCREAVIDGISGYLAESKDVDDLYYVMKKFTKLPYEEREQMGIEGRKHMEEYFDKKIVIRETVEGLYK